MKIFTANNYIKLRAGMIAGFSALALYSCSNQDLPSSADAPENASMVSFNLSFNQDFDIGHEIIPMPDMACSRAEGSAYNNFKMYSGQLAIMKELSDGRYFVYRTLEPVLNSGTPTYLDGKMNLADYIEGAGQVYLLPGEYYAVLMINGPLDFLQEGDILDKNESIIDEISYLHSLRDMYFASQKFTVQKGDQLQPNPDDSNTVVNLKADRLASPVRFILTTDDKYQKAYGVKMEMGISAKGSEIPAGMNIKGEYIWKPASDIISLNSKMDVVHTRISDNENSKWYMFPSYAEKDVSVPTSPFFFTRIDGKTDVTVNFNISKLYLTVSGEVLYEGAVNVNNVKVSPDHITNIILNYSSKDGKLSYSVDEEEIQYIESLWNSSYPDVPFNYIEYN